MSDSEMEKRLIQMEQILSGIAGKYFICYADRQDAVQECMCKAWQFRKNLKNATALEAWLVRIMKNVCVSMCRKSVHTAPFYDERISTVEDVTEQWMQTCALHDALQSIPRDWRTVFCGYYLSGLTIRELSETSGLCMGTVRSRIYRSRQHLKAVLER